MKKEIKLKFDEAEDLIAYAMATIDKKVLKEAISYANILINAKDTVPIDELDVDNHQGSGSYDWMECEDILMNDPIVVANSYAGYNVIELKGGLFKDIMRMIKKAEETENGAEALVESCEKYYDDHKFGECDDDDVDFNLIEDWKIIAKSIDIKNKKLKEFYNKKE